MPITITQSLRQPFSLILLNFGLVQELVKGFDGCRLFVLFVCKALYNVASHVGRFGNTGPEDFPGFVNPSADGLANLEWKRVQVFFYKNRTITHSRRIHFLVDGEAQPATTEKSVWRDFFCNQK